MIQLKGIRKNYKAGFIPKEVEVLKGLDLEVNKGEVFGYLGPNGAGKTTTIKILMDLMPPTEGSASINGIDVKKPDSRLKVGYLPEQPYFYDYLTGFEIVDYCGRLFRIPNEVRIKRADELIERVGLKDVRDKPLVKYSRGMLQRIGIAQALINDPDILILDEPLSGLDPVGRKEVIDLIIERKDLGNTVFFSSHILADTEQFCDKVGIINKGILIAEGKLNEILKTSEEGKNIEIVFKVDKEFAISKTGELGELRKISNSIYGLKVEQVDDVNEVLSKLISNNAKIHTVKRYKQSLEDLFFETIK
ncbi:MAG: ABC transporter ATP-binding protein [bacterium]|nr:ABC transporter ATP-binding protein [bacterium]